MNPEVSTIIPKIPFRVENRHLCFCNEPCHQICFNLPLGTLLSHTTVVLNLFVWLLADLFCCLRSADPSLFGQRTAVFRCLFRHWGKAKFEIALFIQSTFSHIIMGKFKQNLEWKNQNYPTGLTAIKVFCTIGVAIASQRATYHWKCVTLQFACNDRKCVT